MPQLFVNNAYSALASAITNVATSLTVATGTGSRFPSPTGGDYFLLTLANTAGGPESSWEIVKVTARSGDVMTVVRAQEGTSAVAWAGGTPVDLRITAGAFNNKTDVGHTHVKADVGLGNVDNTSDANKPVSTATQTALDLKAPLASPALTGVPTAPTAAGGTNTTQLATTAFVASAISASGSPTASSTTPVMDGTGAAGVATTYARGDHVHPTDTSRQAANANLTTYAGKTPPSGAVVGTTDTQTLSAKTLTGLKETKVAMGANAVDLNAGNYFTKTFTAQSVSLTVSNVPAAGTAGSFILEVTNAGLATITWPTGTKWAGGTAPTLTSAGVDILGFYTHDGGTTWRGLVLAKDSK